MFTLYNSVFVSGLTRQYNDCNSKNNTTHNLHEKQLAYSTYTNSRPWNKKIRTNVKNTVPVRKKLCEIEKMSEIDTTYLYA